MRKLAKATHIRRLTAGHQGLQVREGEDRICGIIELNRNALCHRPLRRHGENTPKAAGEDSVHRLTQNSRISRRLVASELPHQVDQLIVAAAAHFIRGDDELNP